MKIKIDERNSCKIEAALAAVNNKSNAHTYTKANQIIELAEEAENDLLKLVELKKNAVDASLVSTSGSPVAKAYGHHERNATKVKLDRLASGWYLTEACHTTIATIGGYTHLNLTTEQDDLAVKKFRSQYNVKKG
jgi:hypothetical protein